MRKWILSVTTWSILASIVLSENPLQIVISDENTSELRENVNTGSSPLPEQYQSDSYRNWYNENFDKLNNIQDSTIHHKNVAKANKHFFYPYSDKYSRSSANGFSRSPPANIEFYRETDPVITRSKHRKANPQDLKNLPAILQHVMRYDNSVVHYHEHEHFHKHKKLPMNPHRVPGRLKHSENNGMPTHVDQTFESTKNYYHQRDNPIKYGSRIRNKHNQHVDHHNSAEEEEHRSNFGQKKNHKLNRDDLHFKRHRRHPPWRKDLHGYKSRG